MTQALFLNLWGIVELGVILSILVMGIYFHTRVLHQDDFTVEGSFSAGGACVVTVLLHNGNAWLALPLAMVVGALMGSLTGLIADRLKVNTLISGIIVSTGLFSINLNSAGASSSLMNYARIFEETKSAYSLIVLSAIALATMLSLKWLLQTELGFLLKAIGDNPEFLKSLGKKPNVYTCLGLAIGNMLAALSGALFVQYLGYFSIWGNIGILVAGIASLVLAELINKGLSLALIIGPILYQAVIALTFAVNINPNWNKLITAVLVILLIQISNSSNKLNGKD
ncbi:MAG: hypothetical protein K0S74_1769 [Chlamydiales bacterium]|jgi:putative ABC transport system permease protein|nr:hypothetical protein [Chlamydiales bacterium]